MNLPVKANPDDFIDAGSLLCYKYGHRDAGSLLCYKYGHRDARHAAVEAVLAFANTLANKL